MLTLIHNWFSKPLARHLREPVGIFGRITANMMNSTNNIMTETAINYLDIEKKHHVLDVGFGGGIGLKQLLQKASEGHVSGVEISETMLVDAKKKFQAYIVNKKLSLYKGAIESLPLSDNCFDRICTLNTIYFWQNPKRAIKELFRVCKINGKINIAFRPRDIMQKMKFTQYNFTLYQIGDVITLLENAGFADIVVENSYRDELGFCCIVAVKN